MQIRELGGSGINCSVLGFGCSALLGRSSRAESLRALGAAWDAGITLYDTARSYGYGESEALLGEFLSGRRDQAIISTKFGIVPTRPALWKRMAKPAVRALLSITPSARAMVRKQTSAQLTANQFTTQILETSIHESLRKLRTDYVDLLFLHAAPATVLEQDDLLTAMEKLVTAGKVRVAGISADPDVIELTVERRPRPLRALQFPCNVFDLSAARVLESGADAGFGAIANHPFGGAVRVQQSREVLGAISASSDVSSALREKLGKIDDEVLADVVLNIILSYRSIHAVVPAMMKLPHLAKNVSAVVSSRFTRDEIGVLREKISASMNGRALTAVRA